VNAHPTIDLTDRAGLGMKRATKRFQYLHDLNRRFRNPALRCACCGGVGMRSR